MPPMPFWDRFALWVYLGLADLLPVGRDVVVRLFEHAYTAGHLDITHANPVTLLLISGVCRPGSPVRVAAEAQIARRRLTTQYDLVRGIQRGFIAPRLTEVLEANRPHRAVMAQLLIGVLTNPPGHEVWINLTEYLLRINPEDPVMIRNRVTHHLTGAIQRYYRAPIGTYDFLGLLYRHANGFLGVGVAALPVYGAGSTELDEVEDADEQAFLLRCGLHLTDTDRMLLFMHLYGRLTVNQIAASLRFSGIRGCTPDWVASEIERCWMIVL